MVAMHHRTAEYLAFARATSTVFAAIGQANALVDSGYQDGIPTGHRKVAPARLHRDRKKGWRERSSRHSFLSILADH